MHSEASSPSKWSSDREEQEQERPPASLVIPNESQGTDNVRIWMLQIQIRTIAPRALQQLSFK
jgi:hypothetical protein